MKFEIGGRVLEPRKLIGSVIPMGGREHFRPSERTMRKAKSKTFKKKIKKSFMKKYGFFVMMTLII